YHDPLLALDCDFISFRTRHPDGGPGGAAGGLTHRSGAPPGGAPGGGILNDPSRFAAAKGENTTDEKLTYLPLCHVAERLFSSWSMAYNGPILNFAESIDTVQMNLREVQPTIFFAVPRIWERIHAGVLIRLQDATRLKRLTSAFGLKLAAYIGAKRVENDGDFTLGAKLAYWVGSPIFFRSLRTRIGLRHCRYASSGAAPIAPEVLEFFMGLGIPVYELYGMTENTACATTNFDGRVKVGTVGEPYASIGFRIDPENGEIQTKHPAVFPGYWNKPEATAETFTQDGWLKTGDVGVWVDGTHVKIIDRIKHIIITSGGKNISPSEIENSLKTSPYVKEAMVIGDGRKYLAALIGIEFDVVGDWALRRQIPYTTYRDLSEKEEVIELIQGVVNKTNERFARAEQIKVFRMIPKELDHEDGELTATQKIKRSAMEDMFGDLVESMYS
ncbi:MAG: AMP-binding protein, partial [Acidimicrobiia bacterium]